MRAAMAAAEVGDDVYGEDPTVLVLQERVAELLGHEAALFTPSGSMANQLGIRLTVRPGEEVLCDSGAHIVRAELGAHAAFGGVTTRTWTAPRGLLDLADVLKLAAPAAGPHLVSTGVVAVENTHNFGGGTVTPLDRLAALRDWAGGVGVRLHLDGARLWNAHVAAGVPMSSYGALFDTVAVCLSKGLGAPIGSLLVSDAERVAEARWLRKRLGGGMRQVGVLAAAGLYALDHHVERLADDHARAAAIAARLAEVAPGVAPVDTNIVVVELTQRHRACEWDAKTGRQAGAAEIAEKARAEGVLVSALGPTTLRLVTHLDTDDAGCAYAADVLGRLLAG